MSTDDRTSPTGPGATRQRPDPLQMSAAEKVMAEWEARHDVAARGRSGDPEALQHYVARSRLGGPDRPRAAGAQPAPAPAPPASEEQDAPVEPVPPPPVVPAQPRARSGSLLSRLLHRSG